MDSPELRRANLLQLFSDFVAQRLLDAPSTQITGLDREFAALIQVHNTYFSGMKSGARTIGDKLARQVETLCNRGIGWLDVPHETALTVEMTRFVKLAEKAYLAAPAARKDLAKAMRAAIAASPASR